MTIPDTPAALIELDEVQTRVREFVAAAAQVYAPVADATVAYRDALERKGMSRGSAEAAALCLHARLLDRLFMGREG